MSKPSSTNYPNDFLYKTFSHPLSQWIPKTMYRSLSQVRFGTTVGWRYIRDLGGNSSGVPPLPIPNREVKPIHADGTAFSCGRVGSRLFKRRFTIGAFFVFCPLVADSGFNGAFLCLFFLCRRTFLFSVGHSECPPDRSALFFKVLVLVRTFDCRCSSRRVDSEPRR